jgi:hypothetical protein
MNNIEIGIEELQSQKVDKVSGKALSDNNYTTAEKTKLAGIAAGAEVNVQSDWNQSDSSADDFIKNKPGNASSSEAGFMSAADKSKLDGVQAGAQVNPGAATTSANGLMSAADKTKLNGIASGAEVNQNAFSNVKVQGDGTTTIAASSKTDTLNVSFANHIRIIPVASDRSVQIVTDIVDASSSTKGLMSASDKTKLNGIDPHANNYALSRENITMNLSANKGISAGGTALLTFSYLNLDVFTGINFQTSGGAATFDIAIVGFEITSNALYVKVKNTSSSNITLGTGTKAYAKKFS